MITGSDSTLLLTAWATGLLGSTHCIGMCGGISAALSFALPAEARKGWRLLAWQLAYNSGRLLTYTLLGILVGSLAHGILGGWMHSIWPRVFAAVFMLLLGMYLAGWWNLLQKLEGLGGGVWKHLAPLRQKILPIDHPGKALLAGGLWGFLPCGLVYSALALALSRADSTMSGAVMLAFGLGTLPMLLVTGTLAGKLRQLLQGRHVRQLAGLLVMLFALATLASALSHDHHDASQQDSPQQHDAAEHSHHH